MQFERIETLAGLEALAETWDDLLVRSGNYLPFMTHGWVTAWARWLLGKRRLSVIVAKRGGELLGIAPLALSKAGWGIRRLEFAADENVSRYDFIVSPQFRAGFFRYLSRFLLSEGGGWDEVLLNFFPTFWSNYEHVRKTFVEQGYRQGENFFQSPYIRLEGNWEGFLARMNRKFRGNLRNNIRKTEREGVSCSMVDIGKDPERAAEKIFEVERKSWKQAKGTALTSRVEMEGFYRDVIRSAWKEGVLYLALAEKDGRPVAYDFNWAKDDTVFSLKMGYDEEFRNLGVGKVLFAYTIRKSLEDGFKYHELMGLDEAFKTEWTRDARIHSRLHLYHGGIRSTCLYLYNFKVKKMTFAGKVRDLINKGKPADQDKR